MAHEHKMKEKLKTKTD